MNNNNFLFNDISTIKGVGKKTKNYLKKKNIEKVKDLLFDIPYEITDRTKISTLTELEIGKIQNIIVNVTKYNFPRIRNLPNKVLCSEGEKKINIIFFNSNEYYIRKILPLNKKVIISGKVSYYKNTYQITNPTYVKPFENSEDIIKVFPKYHLTEGLSEKIYRNLVSNTLKKIKEIDEWYSDDFLKKNRFKEINTTFFNLHNPKNKINIFSEDLRRIAYDEIFSNLLVLLKTRKIIKIKKNKAKKFSQNIEKKKY